MSLVWVEEFVLLDAPPARIGHCSCLLGGFLWVHGGYYRYGTCLPNLYCMDVQTLEWRVVVHPFEPEPRTNHSAAVISDTKWLVFGGFNGSMYLNDVHCMSLKDSQGTVSWEVVRPTGTPPLPRQHASMVHINGKVYIFGGYSQGHAISELAILDLTAYHDKGLSRWLPTTHISTQHAPSRRSGHLGWAVDDQYMLIFGGYDNKVFCLNTKEEKWEDLQCSGEPPSSRRLAAGVALDRTRLLMFGGLDDYTNEMKCDAWIFDFRAKAWHSLPCEGKCHPEGISSATAVLVAGRLPVVLSFGGERPNNNKHNTVYILGLQREDADEAAVQSILSQYSSAAHNISTITAGLSCRACNMCVVS